MDFNESHTRLHGCGEYTRLDTSLLEPCSGLLHVMYAECPSDSGKVHVDVRQRWLSGDAEVRAAMREVADCAHAGR